MPYDVDSEQPGTRGSYTPARRVNNGPALEDWERELLAHPTEHDRDISGTPQRRPARRATPTSEELEEMRSRIFDRVSVPDQPGPTLRSRQATSQQFEGLAQPTLPKEGEFYKEDRRGYSSNHVSFGWRTAQPDISKVPYHPSVGGMDLGNPPEAAHVTMQRRMDKHYAVDADVNYHSDERPDGHHQGFMIESEKAKPWKIDGMYATKGGRHMANVLLGLAAEHSLSTTGRLPRASNDLSAHSTRVVHGLADKGIIKAPKKEHRNDIDWDHGARSARFAVNDDARAVLAGYEGNTRMSTEDGMRGGRVMRQILKGAKETPVERGLPDPQPLVNARTEAGRFQEFKHHQQVTEKYERPPRTEPSPQQGTLF